MSGDQEVAWTPLRHCMAAFLESPKFNAVLIVICALQAILIGVCLDLGDQRIASLLPAPFVVFFLVELSLRAYVYRCMWDRFGAWDVFVTSMYIFDFFAVWFLPFAIPMVSIFCIVPRITRIFKIGIAFWADEWRRSYCLAASLYHFSIALITYTWALLARVIVGPIYRQLVLDGLIVQEFAFSSVPNCMVTLLPLGWGNIGPIVQAAPFTGIFFCMFIATWIGFLVVYPVQWFREAPKTKEARMADDSENQSEAVRACSQDPS